MSKHTAGPWHAGTGNGAGSIFADSGRMRMEQGGTTLYPIASVVTGWSEEENDANSKLIAAAPELLEALNHVLNVLDGIAEDEGLRFTDDDESARQMALAAIAKAKGE